MKPVLFHEAVLDSARLYRYLLVRGWDRKRPRVAWVMLNPSTADENEDDPTIRRVVGYSQRWGYGSAEVVNLYAYRTPSVEALVQAACEKGVDVIGPLNETAISDAARRADRVVLAWGVPPAISDVPRDLAVLMQLRQLGADLVCLGRTRKGHPKHPLYLRADLNPEPWNS